MSEPRYEVTLRNGTKTKVVGYGPLSMNFLTLENNVLLFASGYYRMDKKEHELDIVSYE